MNIIKKIAKKRAFKVYCSFLGVLFWISMIISYGCKSPASPDSVPQTREYRDNVEVIYTRPTVEGPIQLSEEVLLDYCLYDPATPYGTPYGSTVAMTKIDVNSYRGVLNRVYIQTGADTNKHYVHISDLRLENLHYPDDWTKEVTIEGAYALEIAGDHPSNFRLLFRMSK
jgi:hypothetical protein